MSDGIFLTKETKKFLSDVLCDTIKLKGIFKLIKRQIVNIALNLIDKYGDRYIPDRFDVKINEVAMLCGEKMWTEAAEIVGNVASGEIKIKGDQSIKTRWFVNGAMFFASWIENWIEEKKK